MVIPLIRHPIESYQMLPKNRQDKLDPILDQLKMMKGIEDICQDDFDSNGINVWFNLIPLNQISPRSPVMEFVVPVANIKRQMKTLGHRVTDFPAMRYENVSIHDRSPGDPKRRKIGFDQIRFGIEVFV